MMMMMMIMMMNWEMRGISKARTWKTKKAQPSLVGGSRSTLRTVKVAVLYHSCSKTDQAVCP